jgi:hypothetical protein
MSRTKDELDESAKENWRLSHEWDKCGDSARADEAARRAIKDEKARDSRRW